MKTAMEKLFNIVWQSTAEDDGILHEDEGIEWMNEDHTAVCISRDDFVENDYGDVERVVLSANRYYDPISFGKFIANRIIEIGESGDGNRIEMLELSTRCFNALRRDGIYTIYDLKMAIKEERLLKIRHFGRKCYNEVMAKLDIYDKEDK